MTSVQEITDAYIAGATERLGTDKNLSDLHKQSALALAITLLDVELDQAAGMQKSAEEPVPGAASAAGDASAAPSNALGEWKTWQDAFTRLTNPNSLKAAIARLLMGGTLAAGYTAFRRPDPYTGRKPWLRNLLLGGGLMAAAPFVPGWFNQAKQWAEPKWNSMFAPKQ